MNIKTEADSEIKEARLHELIAMSKDGVGFYARPKTQGFSTWDSESYFSDSYVHGAGRWSNRNVMGIWEYKLKKVPRVVELKECEWIISKLGHGRIIYPCVSPSQDIESILESLSNGKKWHVVCTEILE